MEEGRIPDTAITASSSYEAKSVGPQNARYGILLCGSSPRVKEILLLHKKLEFILYRLEGRQLFEQLFVKYKKTFQGVAEVKMLLDKRVIILHFLAFMISLTSLLVTQSEVTYSSSPEPNSMALSYSFQFLKTLPFKIAVIPKRIYYRVFISNVGYLDLNGNAVFCLIIWKYDFTVESMFSAEVKRRLEFRDEIGNISYKLLATHSKMVDMNEVQVSRAVVLREQGWTYRQIAADLCPSYTEPSNDTERLDCTREDKVKIKRQDSALESELYTSMTESFRTTPNEILAILCSTSKRFCEPECLTEFESNAKWRLTGLLNGIEENYFELCSCYAARKGKEEQLYSATLQDSLRLLGEFNISLSTIGLLSLTREWYGQLSQEAQRMKRLLKLLAEREEIPCGGSSFVFTCWLVGLRSERQFFLIIALAKETVKFAHKEEGRRRARARQCLPAASLHESFNEFGHIMERNGIRNEECGWLSHIMRFWCGNEICSLRRPLADPENYQYCGIRRASLLIEELWALVYVIFGATPLKGWKDATRGNASQASVGVVHTLGQSSTLKSKVIVISKKLITVKAQEKFPSTVTQKNFYPYTCDALF
ncbi:hypothetical protein C0J52_24896 [Blattella germanica]|nr:hypothetical protein C0J52_24896 [Blattella germanica]